MEKANTFKIIKLKQILKDTDLLNQYSHIIKTFSCKNKDVQSFLNDKAIEYEKRGKGCTYLIIDISTNKLIAYFTLSLKAIEFSHYVSKSTKKEIDGFSKNVASIAVILIGQLGKDEKYADLISGEEILKVALELIYKAKNIISGRICLLETEDTEENKKVIDFYFENGFKILQHDKSDKFLQLFKIL